MALTSRHARCFSLVALLLAATPVGCKKAEVRPAPTSDVPPASAVPAGTDACATAGTVTDAVSASYFAAAIPGACLDAKSETRTFGDRGKSTLEELCTTAFDGECEVYRGFGVKRVVGVRYVESLGKQGTVEVYLSQFATNAGALAMYTKRAVGESDPADPKAPKTFGAGDRSAMGTGRGYVWAGDYLIELTYTNDDGSLTQEAFGASAESLLSPIGRAIAKALPRNDTGVPSVRALPVGSMIEGGLAFLPNDAFGIANLGPVGLGYYQDGPARFRIFAIARTDEKTAKADMLLLKSRPKAKPQTGLGDESVAVELDGSTDHPGSHFVVTRVGASVIGVGTEPFTPAQTLDETARRSRLLGLVSALGGTK